jgi:EpsD family peptidyl-prolyl cis-trans isomerase
MNPRYVLVAGSRTCVVVGIAVAAALLAGCGDKKDKPATQTAARVNKEEITVHQINAALQLQRGLKPEQVDAASRRVLERLIDQELALQVAAELKLDRDARVVQAIDAARRDIIARAYAEKVSEGASKSTPAEVKKYYDDNPALFKERRIYQLQELVVQASADQTNMLRTKLAAAKNVNEFIDYLKASNLQYSANQAVRAAEQLPLVSLDAFAKMKDGQMEFSPSPTGARIVVLAGSRLQPVEFDQASPRIEQYLLEQRKRELVLKDLKEQRAAAKIQYLGKYAESVASAPAATEPATGALDDSNVIKGFGK